MVSNPFEIQISFVMKFLPFQLKGRIWSLELYIVSVDPKMRKWKGRLFIRHKTIFWQNVRRTFLKVHRKTYWHPVLHNVKICINATVDFVYTPSWSLTGLLVNYQQGYQGPYQCIWSGNICTFKNYRGKIVKCIQSNLDISK